MSLYNETDGRAIDPTPVVGCVGTVEDVRRIPSRWEEGDVVLLAGDAPVALDGSEFQARFLGGVAGCPPRPDLDAEAALIRFLSAHGAVLTSAHDASDGGLAVALAELAIWSGIGAEIELDSDTVTWFGEGGGRAVVSCRPEDVARLEGVPLRQLGAVGGDSILGLGLAELAAAHEHGKAA